MKSLRTKHHVRGLTLPEDPVSILKIPANNRLQVSNFREAGCERPTERDLVFPLSPNISIDDNISDPA